MYLLAEILIIAFAVALVVYGTRWSRRYFGDKSPWPRVIGVSAFVIVFMGEEIAGRVQMQFVCPDAKVEVYGSVELPRYFFGEEGKPLFVKTNGLPDYETNYGLPMAAERLDKYLDESFESQRELFLIKFRSCFVDKASGDALACANRYRVAGGWTKELVNIDFLGLPLCGEELFFEERAASIFVSK